jgi:hypothetical protein
MRKIVAVCLVAFSGADADAHGGVEHPLVEAGELREIPADLVIVYDDMHPFHGGETIRVRADGSATRVQRDGDQVTEARAQLTDDQLLGLLGAALEARIWEQRAPTRLLVAGESQARVALRAGGFEGGCWELYNELEENQRLIRIKEQLEALVPLP